MVEQTWTHTSKHYYSIWSLSHPIDAHLNFKKIYSSPKSILHAQIKFKKKTKPSHTTTWKPPKPTEVPDYSHVKVIIHTPSGLSGHLLMSLGPRNRFHEVSVQEQDLNTDTLQQKSHLAQSHAEIPVLDLVTGLGGHFCVLWQNIMVLC